MSTILTEIKSLLKYSSARYVIAGGVSLAGELGLILLLTRLNYNPVAAVAIAFWFGLVLSFVLQKVLAFQNYERSTRRLAYQSFAYGLLTLVNYTFTLVAVALLDGIVNVYIARSAALIITLVWNYAVYSKIIFRRSNG